MVFGVWFLALFEQKTAKMANFYLNTKNGYSKLANGGWQMAFI
jgi:hypothetical protein